MRVHLHTLCWNDRPMLDFFLTHYEPWVDRFFILDDHSDDGSREYLESRSDVVLADWERVDPSSFLESARHVYNHAWKQSRGDADWVVVTNIDEHLHHPEMRDYLADSLANGITVVPALGYQMITDAFPDEDSVLWRTCRMGAAWHPYSRVGIFRPDRIEETGYGVGRHTSALAGDVVYPPRDDVINLHYKYLGVEHTLARHRAQARKLETARRRTRGLRAKLSWGRPYDWDESRLRAQFELFRRELVDVSQVDQHAEHREFRWWRTGRLSSPLGRFRQWLRDLRRRIMLRVLRDRRNLETLR